MNRRQFGLAAGAALIAAGLSACGQEAPPAPATPTLTAAQIYDAAAGANGFAVGPMMAANTAYVFFDPTCPHCAVVWNAAKPLAAKMRVVWIPVGFLSPSSGPRGAAILGAPDPVKAMDQSEFKVLNGEQSADPGPASPDLTQKVAANTDILKKIGAQAVPLIVYKNAKTGEYGNQAGQMDTAQLMVLFGLQ